MLTTQTTRISPPSADPLLPHNARRLADIAKRAAEQDREPALAVQIVSTGDGPGRPRKAIYSDLGERWEDMEDAAQGMGVTKQAVYQAMANRHRCRGRMLGHKAFDLRESVSP